MSTRSRPNQDTAMLALFDETVALFHRLRATAEDVHGQGDASACRRGVLKSLDRHGPQTVPQMARARLVSRQHIQVVVNALSGEGLVEFVENPAHRRSSLVRVTGKGKELAQAMNRREETVLKDLAVPCGTDDLRSAAAVLRAVRQALEAGEQNRTRWETAS